MRIRLKKAVLTTKYLRCFVSKVNISWLQIYLRYMKYPKSKD